MRDMAPSAGAPSLRQQHPAGLCSLLLSLYRVKLLKVELAVTLFMVQRHLYNSLYEQYYYLIDGSDILRNTSFIFPNGSFCVSSEMIDNYTNNTNTYKEDESFANHLVAYGQIANTVPSVMVALILGPVMDRFGRKIGIILPIVGKIFQGALSMFIIYYTLDPYYFIIAQFVGGLFGDFTALLAASFSYVADTSTLRWRSLRVAVIEASLAYGGGIGTIVTGYWLRSTHCDFIPLLWFYIGSNAFLAACVIFLIPESLSSTERMKLWGKRRGLRPYVEGFRLFFGGLSLPSTWKLYVSTFVIVLAVLNIYGGFLIDVYFVKAPPFDLTTLQTGFYQAARQASQGTADLVFMGLLAILWASDAWVMLIGLLFHCVCNVLLGFATKLWQLYASKGNLMCQHYDIM
jgi:PCFT/HCP family folate transporter-like MFS transporter 1/3